MHCPYLDYIEETGVMKVVRSPKGFATYKIYGNECYIEDIYVLPEYRREKVASLLADLVAERARQNGCVMLTGSVNLSRPDPSLSLKALIGYGMKFHSTKDEMAYYAKEL